jgi:hypothetical protein
MKSWWGFSFKLSAGLLIPLIVVFVSIPTSSSLKKYLGLTCGILTALCIASKYFARKKQIDESHESKMKEQFPPPSVGNQSLDLDD